MSNSKNYNSIVFLTTLSVYLGLVLVGATPPIMTQAALTQRFEIQNEIETEDDLDKNPEEKETFSNDNLPTLFARLLLEIQREVESGKISLPLQTDFKVDGRYEKSEFSGGAGIASNISNQTLSTLIQNAFNQKFQPKAFEIADYDGNSKKIKIRIETDAADFSLKVSFGKTKAEQFADFLNREFSSSAVLIEDKLLSQIYENTKSHSENNQVFIVTRLPRASIDALLAETNAK